MDNLEILHSTLGFYTCISVDIFVDFVDNVNYCINCKEKNMDKNNIILIGMPACGKTTIGKILSKSIHKNFIDTDYLLEKSIKLSPREIVIRYGEEFFLNKQEEILLASDFSNAVVSTGGSVVYSKKLMQKFDQCGLIVYLKDSVDQLSKRLADGRRIIGSADNDFAKLYRQRDMLYAKYAHRIVDCSNHYLADMAKMIQMEVIQHGQYNW